MLKTGVIGIGNCGNQIAAKVATELRLDALAINSSENDLATLPDGVIKKIIGNTEGSGKNRDQAKKYLKDKILELSRDEDLIGFMKDKDTVFIVGSTGGGTGSGIGPVMYDIFSNLFLNADRSKKAFILTGVLPRLSEGYSTQVNTASYLEEVFSNQDAVYALFDNNSYADETAYKVLTHINEDVAQFINVCSGQYNIATPYDSMDEEDMKVVLKTPGRIAVYSLLDMKEKDLDNVSIEDLLIEKMKHSGQVELERDGVVTRTGIITNLSEKLNENFDSQIQKVRQFIGEPIEEFLHIGVNSDKALPNNAFLMLSGLSQISDRVDKIRDRIKEIDDKKREQEESKARISTEELSKMNELLVDKTSDNTEEKDIDLAAIFSKYNA